jgi:succinate dehydrogenase hydrophobic anchor subunit
VDSSVVGYDGGWNVRDEEQRVAAETGPPVGGREARSEERSSIILRKAVGLAAVVLVLVIILIVYGYAGKPGSGWIGVAHKRLWDYLDLLFVPAALALGVY